MKLGFTSTVQLSSWLVPVFCCCAIHSFYIYIKLILHFSTPIYFVVYAFSTVYIYALGLLCCIEFLLFYKYCMYIIGNWKLFVFSHSHILQLGDYLHCYGHIFMECRCGQKCDPTTILNPWSSHLDPRSTYCDPRSSCTSNLDQHTASPHHDPHSDTRSLISIPRSSIIVHLDPLDQHTAILDHVLHLDPWLTCHTILHFDHCTAINLLSRSTVNIPRLSILNCTAIVSGYCARSSITIPSSSTVPRSSLYHNTLILHVEYVYLLANQLSANLWWSSAANITSYYYVTISVHLDSR